MVSILTNMQALPSQELKRVTQLHYNLILVPEQPYFLEKCDVAMWSVREDFVNGSVCLKVSPCE